MSIIDRRKSNKQRSLVNKKKFLDRYKQVIRKNVQQSTSKESIKDIGKKGHDVTINKKTIDEPIFRPDPTTGKKYRIFGSNKEYKTGDKIARPPQGGQGGAGNGGDGQDDFTFSLTKEEFLDVYFSDMELPNFVKETIKRSIDLKQRRAGYSKEGIPARLNIKKTFENSIARRIATKSQIKNQLNNAKKKKLSPEEIERLKKKKPRYLDDVDIRYDYFVKEPKPKKNAVMFCLMDVSGSMSKWHKDIAKRFYLLLYLFLEKEYDSVELVFIRHHHEARVVDETEFFYGMDSGGTVVSTGINLMAKEIEERFPLDEWNIYVSHASDGDNWDSDEAELLRGLETKILPVVQYYAYIEIMDDMQAEWFEMRESLYRVFGPLAAKYQHFNQGLITSPAQVYPVLRKLFSKENANES